MSTGKGDWMEWKPISLERVYDKIIAGEANLRGAEQRLWELVKVEPSKWQEPSYGTRGGGFWVVGLMGNLVIWYNDIECGFNISKWSTYGTIDEYVCDQDELNECITKLYAAIDKGFQIVRAGPPRPGRFAPPDA